jgi:hypothetical protein
VSGEITSGVVSAPTTFLLLASDPGKIDEVSPHTVTDHGLRSAEFV